MIVQAPRWRPGPVSIALAGFLAGGAALAAGIPTDGTWVSNGPFGGTVQGLAIDPDSPDWLYAGTEFNGVFRSLDGGHTWSRTTTGSFTIHDVVHSGLRGRYYTAGKTLRTDDGGLHWQDISAALPFGSRSLAVHPGDPDTVYVGTGGIGGVYKTTDAGRSWINVNPVLDTVWGLAIDPSSPQSVYASDDTRVHKSTDGGRTWQLASDGLPGVRVTTLTVHPFEAQTVYAGTIEGLFRSTDGAGSWLRVDALPTHPVSRVMVDATRPETIYAATFFEGLYRSTDDGASWDRLDSVANGGFNEEFVALALDPRDPTHIVTGNRKNGVFQSHDDGASWELTVDGLGSVWALDLAIDPNTPGTVFVAGEGGVWKSVDRGETWTLSVAGLQRLAVSSVVVDPTDPQILYAGVSQIPGGVHKSTDGGMTWTLLEGGISNSQIETLAIDPTDPQVVYAGLVPSIFKTVDGGETWTLQNDGLFGAFVREIEIDGTNTSRIFAALGFGGGGFVTTDGAESWQHIDGIDDDSGVSFAIDPANPQVVYAGMLNGFFRSLDGGKVWEETDPTGSYPAIEIDPGQTNVLFRAAGQVEDTVQVSEDGGDSWRNLGDGISGLSVNLTSDLAFDPVMGDLFVTNLDGVYRLGPSQIFADDFESGTTESWDQTVD